MKKNEYNFNLKRANGWWKLVIWIVCGTFEHCKKERIEYFNKN